jgi:adenylosuccinate lyase
MLERYTYPEMGKIWTLENKFKMWLKVEIAVCEAWKELKVIPEKALKKIKDKASFSLKRIEEIEKEVNHDLIAFLKAVGENLGEEAKYLHFGITSYDIEDTALALLLRESAEIIIKDIEELIDVLKTKAAEHKYTLMIGRTHGVHAEPITFGFKILNWLAEMERNLKRMKIAKENISYGKISGAVGTYANVPPFVEKYVCRKLKLKPEKISTQIVQRDRHAEFLTTLAIIASSIEKFSTEIRNLQRTEILEVEEFFSKTQRGSSAMPHKRNPIVCERLSGLARVVRANSLVALENINLWHERDLTNSAPERIIFPDSCILVDYILRKFIEVIKNLKVYSENMQRNLKKTSGIISSQKIMLSLIEKGISREDAYKLVQKLAMQSWNKNKNFEKLVLKDKSIRKYLTEEEIKDCIKPENYLKNIEEIYKRFNLSFQ